ncbi:MAG: TRAP transporter large permease [Fusobacteriaceae bacterium]|jgi:C4-dicarboxylate transporter DctM subunit|nr:TRAP transporter large permease [Fusobacteriaceae bacterium]
MTALFIVLFVALILGVPIGIALVLGAIATYVSGFTTIITQIYVYKGMIDGLCSYPLLAVPLFIFSGLVMAKGGIAKKLFEFIAYFMGKMTAGLPIASVITCLFYGALSGSGPATTAAVGSMVVPYLEDLGYNKNFSAALVATAGGLGVIIPPSVPFIIYCLSANQSVSDMFIAGIVPGFLIAACLSITAWLICRIKGEDKEKLIENHKNIKSRGFWPILKDSFWALLTPVIILGGIYGGIVTPTEAATVSVVYSVIVSMFIYKTITFKDIPGILHETGKNLAPMLVVIAAAVIFGRVLTLLNLHTLVTNFITSIVHSKVIILLILNLILLLAGMLINTTSAILILTPVLLPIAKSIGVHPIHFGMIMVVNLSIGFVTPPVGSNLFVACGMFNIPITTMTRHTLPFIFAFAIALILVTFIPIISLCLI